MPKISAQFRRREGIPYAVEQFSGKQFRCRHCNKVFWEEKDLDRHLEYVFKEKRTGTITIDPAAPQLNHIMKLKISYVYDLSDCLKRRYLKLKNNELYDGITLTKQIKNKEMKDEC
jgi:hypothetical protein